ISTDTLLVCLALLMPPSRPPPLPFPYTPLFRSAFRTGDGPYLRHAGGRGRLPLGRDRGRRPRRRRRRSSAAAPRGGAAPGGHARSEEHTSELQSRENLVCRLLLEKKTQSSHVPH